MEPRSESTEVRCGVLLQTEYVCWRGILTGGPDSHIVGTCDLGKVLGTILRLTVRGHGESVRQDSERTIPPSPGSELVPNQKPSLACLASLVLIRRAASWLCPGLPGYLPKQLV